MKTKARLLIASGIALTLGTTLYMGTGFAHSDKGHGHHKGKHHDHAEKLFETFDTDQDGTVTRAEVEQVRADYFERFDKNDDGNLSLEEYEALWLEAMRERMVDRFQKLDNDGDGSVTTEEFGEFSTKLFSRMDRDEDGEITRDEISPRYHHKGHKGDKDDDK